MAYVKEFHTTGVTWNPKGVDCKEYDSSAPAAIVAPAAAVNVKADKSRAAETSKAGLFSALNKGGAITGGLKTVTKDMQTWRTEFKGGDAPAPPVTVQKVVTARPVAAMKGPPVCEFNEGSNKWKVEYQIGDCKIEIKNKKETVYIFGCVGANIDVKGKCKSIIIDNCKKTKVTFDAAMASVESVNCQRVQITCRDMVPAVAIDKTDGIVVFLPPSSLTTEIVASKSSEMNLQWNDENGELVERPIPEQYVHRIKGLGVTADVSDLYSH
jgi:adenylyl cyclase-associated protein